MTVPPAINPVPIRTTEESLNLLANTCSNLAAGMARLQSRDDVIDSEKEDRANQSWANLTNMQGRVIDNVQEAPLSRGLPRILPLHQPSEPPQVPLQPVTVTSLRVTHGLQEEAANMQGAMQSNIVKQHLFTR